MLAYSISREIISLAKGEKVMLVYYSTLLSKHPCDHRQCKHKTTARRKPQVDRKASIYTIQGRRDPWSCPVPNPSEMRGEMPWRRSVEIVWCNFRNKILERKGKKILMVQRAVSGAQRMHKSTQSGQKVLSYKINVLLCMCMSVGDRSEEMGKECRSDFKRKVPCEWPTSW